MAFLTVMALSSMCAAPPSFDEFFAEFAKKRDGINLLEAKFTQKTIMTDDTESTEGTLAYAKPRRIVFHINEPNRTDLVDGRRGYEYEPEIKQVIIFDIEDNPQADIFFLGFDSDTETLRKSYDVSLFTVTDEPRGSRGILVKPKPENAETAHFIEANLYLRDKDYLPYRIRILNEEKAQVIIEVKEYVVNGTPDPKRFQIELAPGTKIVENDNVVETVGEGGKRIPEAVGEKKPESGPDAAKETPKPDAVSVKELAPPAPKKQDKP